MRGRRPPNAGGHASSPDGGGLPRSPAVRAPFKSKYRAIPVVHDGIRFASTKEGKRYLELKMLERAGKIWNLELQPKFDLTINGVKVGRYVGDFSYFDKTERVIEDSKGFRTPTYRLKKRVFEALYPGMKIRET